MKQIFTFIAILIGMVMTPTSTKAYDFEVDSIYYDILSATDLTCSIVGAHPDLTSFQLNKTVEYKGRTLRIKSISGLSDTKLVSLSFGNDIDSIPPYAFVSCDSLKIIDFNNVKVIGENAFRSSGNSRAPLLKFGKVEIIGNSAFYDSWFKNIDLSGVKIINDKAFYGTTRDSITISPSVEYIGEKAFGNNHLYKLTFSFNKNPLKITKDIFGYYSSPYKLVINRDIISSVDLYYNKNIVIGPKVTICPRVHPTENQAILDLSTTNIKIIPERTFSLDTGDRFSKIILPESMDSIKAEAFYRTGSYCELTLPKKLKYLGEAAFYMFDGRGVVDSKDWTLDSIPNKAFAETRLDLTNFIIPNTVKYIGQEAFEKAFTKTNLEISIDIPPSVEIVDANAFSGCTDITTLTIEEGSQPLKVRQGGSVHILSYGKRGETEASAYQTPAAVAVYLTSPLYIPTVTNLKVGRDVVYEPILQESSSDIPDMISFYSVQNTGFASSLNLPNSSVETLEISNLRENPFLPKEIYHEYVEYAKDNNKYVKKIFNDEYKLSPSLYPENLTGLKSFNCNLTTPPELSADFPTSVYVGVTLNVPIGCKESYESAPYWKNFWEIKESDFSGVKEIISDSDTKSPIEWYDLNLCIIHIRS